jgi:phosphohistidine phosphatase
MKTLGLLRHAKSDWNDARLRDFDRPLNARGRKGAGLIGQHIHNFGVHWDKVLASPAVRSAETIELAAAAGFSGGADSLPINWDRRIYLASSATLIDLLGEVEEPTGTVLMVGHNPGLEDLIFDLVPDDGTSPLRDVVEAKFPTATYAVLELAIDRWAEITERCARLTHLMRPRDLDPALGPDLND